MQIPQEIIISSTSVTTVAPKKIRSSDSSDGSERAIIHTNGQVESVLSAEEPQAPPSSEVSELRLPSFMVRKENGVFINLATLANREIILSFLNYIFEGGYYFKDTNHAVITKILYDFEKTATEFCKIAQEAHKDPLVKIASDIKKFDEKRISLYREPKVSPDGKSADYSFDPAYMEEVGEDGVTREIEAKIDVDEFIAAVWKQKIRFGFDMGSIKKAIDENNPARVTIAGEKDPTLGKDATMEPMISFEIKCGVKEEGKPKVDILVYEQSYIRVEKDIPLYRKKNRQDGNHGWTIHGERIEPEKPTDFSIDTFIGVGVRKETINGEECLVSNYSGFPRLENETEKGGGKKLHKIHVDEVKTFEKGIDVSTGKVSADNDMRSSETIVFDTEGKNIFADKDVEANVHASENVFIKGNVLGSTQGNVLSWKHQKISTIKKGRVVSDTGDIVIEGHANSAYLEAKWGTIRIENVANSTIIAKRVEIAKDSFNCTIIAEEVIIWGKTTGCRIISEKTIDIAESAQKGSFENTFSLFSQDMSGSIDRKEKTLRETEEETIRIENGLDASVTSDFPKIMAIIPNKEKRLKIIGDLMEILDDQKSIQEEKNKTYVELFKKMRTALENSHIYWKKLQHHRSSIAKLSEEIAAETAIMESSRQELRIKIDDIQWPSNVQQIMLPKNRKLLELGTDETDTMSGSLAGRDTPVWYALEKIPVPVSGWFNWKPA